ncbi:hypothetical protein [Actinoplanes regularis]|uniref:Uncharacterized protein n=1 Tax=Actinoplanes regularis TaxID=52697 RepID=A0A238XJP0_9ACTN|nr:hypothetical protein [Actinoplanes regularis]SNR58930.1 hypothetical protein SAMN06264365_103504 [Actinoplanes regularis]
MPSSSRRSLADGRTSVTFRDDDGRRHRHVFATRHLAEQFQHGLAAGQAPAAPVPAGPAPAAPPAHHRSVHPLRQLARTLIDGSPASLALTFLPAPDLDDIEQDWPAPTATQRHLSFLQPR